MEYLLKFGKYLFQILLFTNSDGSMGLLPNTLKCGLHMRRECRERFPWHRLQRKPLVSDPSMHHGTCVTHVPWCMSGSLTRGGGENVPGIPGACATHSFTYLARGPCHAMPCSEYNQICIEYWFKISLYHELMGINMLINSYFRWYIN